MPIKSKRVNLSIPPSKIQGIFDVGRNNKLQSRDGAFRLTKICTDIVFFFYELYSDTDVQTYLKKGGGTLFDLISRLVKQHVSNQNDK